MRPAACVLAAVLLAAVGSARADEPTTEKLVKNYFAAAKEAAEVFDSVKDKAGAVHQGSATTLYPTWESNAPGEVTSLVFDS